jgi:hypothetical protein
MAYTVDETVSVESIRAYVRDMLGEFRHRSARRRVPARLSRGAEGDDARSFGGGSAALTPGQVRHADVMPAADVHARS